MAMHRDKQKAMKAELKQLGMKGRDMLQVLIEDGFDHFSSHSNSTRLTEVIEVCMECKTFPTNAIRTYILDHANVYWSKTKKQFLKDGDGHFTKPTLPWYDYKNPQESTLFDWDKSRRAALKKAIKHYKQGKLKNNAGNCQKSAIEREAKALNVKLVPDWDKSGQEQTEETKAAKPVTASA